MTVHQASFSKRPPSALVHRLRTVPPLILLSFVTLAILICLAVAASWIAPQSAIEQHLMSRLQPPEFMGGDGEFFLGADHLGRDVFSRLLHALRTTLLIAGLGVVIGVLTGTVTGLLSGTLGGRVDQCLMLLVDAQAAIPLTLLALTAVALFGATPLALVLIVGISDFGKYARVIRSQVMVVKRLNFVEAAIALGLPSWRVVLGHIFPNTTSPLIVLATINFSSIVILESALSFLGVGVQPPETSLGQMLGEARNYLITSWWLAAIPAAVIVAITMTVSLVGDWLRDVLDPRLKR